MTNTSHYSKPVRSPPEDVSSLCRLLKALGNPNRLRILLYLLQNEASVGEIESSLNIRQPNLSQELKKLRDAELVTTKRQSKTIFYRLKSNAVKTLLISVGSALDRSNQLYDGPQQPIIGKAHDSSGSECGLFANIRQYSDN